MSANSGGIGAQCGRSPDGRSLRRTRSGSAQPELSRTTRASSATTSSATRSSTLPTPGQRGGGEQAAPPSAASGQTRSSKPVVARRWTCDGHVPVARMPRRVRGDRVGDAAARRRDGRRGTGRARRACRRRAPGPAPTSGPVADHAGLVARRRSRGVTAVALEAEDHRDLRAVVGRACPARATRSASRSAAGRGRGRGVGARQDAAALVATMTRRTRPVDARRATSIGPSPSRVGVDDDVRAGLGDGQLDVRQRSADRVERLAESAEGVADHRDVLGAGGQGELEIGCEPCGLGCASACPGSCRAITRGASGRHDGTGTASRRWAEAPHGSSTLSAPPRAALVAARSASI